jgi:large subunit ribosomal protein L1
MAKSKKQQKPASLVKKDKNYSLQEAIKLVKETSKTKFDAGIEAHIRLGIDPKKGNQQIRSTVVLPHGNGKTKKVIVFTDEPQTALEAGADQAGGKELIEEIKKTGKCNFDIALAKPKMMKELAPIAKILGPKGLMPSPKNDTVTENVKQALNEIKKGKISFKNDETGNVHALIGKVSFSDEKLIDNYNAFVNAVKKAKPSNVKGQYFRNISLASSMGPGIKIELPKL